MSALQIVAIILGVGITIVGWGLLARAVKHFLTVFKLGRPEYGRRTSEGGARTATLLREFLGHGRMARLPVVAVAHWITMISFGILFLTLVQATVQLFDPRFALPLIGHFYPYEWITELFAMTGIISILVLMGIRLKNHPRSGAGEDGRRSRFFGSTFWQAYYVEYTILGVGLCIALLRGMEYSLMQQTGEAEHATMAHFPLTGWIGELFSGMSVEALEAGIIVVALIKLLISYAWMITISLTPTMGVAWHRFLAFFNIWFKRHPDGRTSLAELQPMEVDGKPFSMEVMEEMDEDSTLGVGKVEDFTWKGLLDFSTCTECGRCQSQCPAWNTDKPLSPKMLMMTLRDHAHSKAPFIAAAEGKSGVISAGGARSQTASGPVALAGQPGADGGVAVAEPDVINWGEMSLIGQTGYSQENPLEAYNPHGPDAVIDEDVLWSCTTCGACVEQCPVDIEHVDHIVDMRRYQTLIESAFPSELGGLFKNMESKGNPWGMGAKARLEWAKDLPFKVKVFGEDVESADDVDYLFWVGCAGAYEDRAKKTTRAVAELFDHAGVDFAVLGNGETCTGDSARRAGNEVLFQMLAEQNVETLNEVGATKIVVTCAHCFNTIKNEYPQLGGKYEVVHHTQLLNRLVREKRITPVNRPTGTRKSTSKDVASTGPSVTYHDPCYLGRHNNVYAPPRELISALPGVELKEMERSKEKSFCCGAGGARMWMEEKLGSRINLNRTEEAIATGADRIAIGCPFCRVMMTDGLTAKQAEGASEDIEVVDVAQMLLASVKEAKETKAEEPAAEKEAAGAPEAKSAAPAPAEDKEAKGDAPAAPSEPGTAAEQNAAPSWESGAAVGGAAAVGAGAAAAAAASDEDTTAAEKNAAPSWESDAPAAKADATPAEQNAAPSWESDAPAAKADATPAEQNAAPSWETGTPAPKADATPAEAATSDDSVAAQNAAPSWETGAAPAAATPAPEAKETEATSTEETAPKQEQAAPAADGGLAAQNAAPSWETGAAPAAAASEPEASAQPATDAAPAEADTAAEAATPAESETTTEQPEASAPAAPTSSAPADDDVAAHNAAPSWESGAAPAAATPAPQATEAEPEAPAQSATDASPAEADTTAEAATPAESETTDQPEATAPAAPTSSAPADDDVAAHNAAPSWETGTPAAPAAEAKPSESSAPEASAPEPTTEASAPEQATEAEPEAAADAESTETAPEAEPAEASTSEAEASEPAAPEAEAEQGSPAPSSSSGTTDPDLLSELAKKNAKPDWE